MTDPRAIELLTEAGTGRPLPELLIDLQRIIGISSEIDVRLWDRQWRKLVSIRTGDAIPASPDDLSDLSHRYPVHHPLQIYGDAIGFVTIGVAGPADGPDAGGHDGQAAIAAALAGILALAVRAGEPIVDVISVRRRREEMSLPAEMQSALLPPTQFAASGISISAAVEPAYETGGDVFDYAIDGNRVFVGVLDARGHGLRAAATSVVAAGALRRARRDGADLASMAREVGSAINAVGDEVEFVSAVLVELGPATGEGSWLSADHLPPLVVDDGIAALELSPALPLGPEVNGRTSEPIVKIPDRPDGHGTWRGPSSRTCCS